MLLVYVDVHIVAIVVGIHCGQVEQIVVLVIVVVGGRCDHWRARRAR